MRGFSWKYREKRWAGYWRKAMENQPAPARHCARAAEEMGSKSTGLCLRGFESPRRRPALLRGIFARERHPARPPSSKIPLRRRPPPAAIWPARRLKKRAKNKKRSAGGLARLSIVIADPTALAAAPRERSSPKLIPGRRHLPRSSIASREERKQRLEK